ncbi:hypothetical protein, partial [Tamilnaduibacter salinus]|uniref:hypothetical protein n=1 Tax=Tamilnaduibacter salinus TaxID=1484056 RepID=UPI001A9C93E8
RTSAHTNYSVCFLKSWAFALKRPRMIRQISLLSTAYRQLILSVPADRAKQLVACPVEVLRILQPSDWL